MQDFYLGWSVFYIVVLMVPFDHNTDLAYYFGENIQHSK